MTNHHDRETLVPSQQWAEWLHQADSPALSPALRAGRRLYLSGHTGVPEPGMDLETQIRLAYQEVTDTLEFAGASWSDVVSGTSYHVNYTEQCKVLAKVHNEFVREPYPAWTAVGVAELIDGVVIEITVVAELTE